METQHGMLEQKQQKWESMNCWTQLVNKTLWMSRINRGWETSYINGDRCQETLHAENRIR